MTKASMVEVLEPDPRDVASIPLIARLSSDTQEEIKSDASSVITLSDYSPATWGKIVSYGVPTVGIAFLAIAHPLFFLAGAGLLFGGAYAKMGLPDCATYCGKSPKSENYHESKFDLPHQVTISTVVSADSSDEMNSDDRTSPRKSLESTADHVLPAPLANMIVEEEFSSLHAKDFFQIFFGDDAPFSFVDFQRQGGDLDIEYSKWGESKKRLIRFKTPTRTPFFGPSHAQASKTQVLTVYSKSCVVMESTTSLEDIPYSDRFVVREQWVFTSTPEKICSLRVTAQAVFSQSCPFESQISSKSSATLREVLSSWTNVAKKALIATERKRRKEHEPNSMDEVEVAYEAERKRICIVGEEMEEDDDWEMDPAPAKARIKASLHVLRRSLSKRLTKKESLPVPA
ncbi:hypothetical protein MHU86_6312 [Fragilaria crotonensis]|nr:hypothetical protein MHU86_6312 [Fragilaria crotonensis]